MPATLSRCPAISTKSRDLPFLLLYSLDSLLPLGTRGGLRCVSFPPPEHWSPGPLSIGVTFSSGQPGNTTLIYCGRPGARFLRNLAFLRLARNRPFKLWLCPPGKHKICLISAAPARDEVPCYASVCVCVCVRACVCVCSTIL